MFGHWLARGGSAPARAAVLVRLARLEAGHMGDCKSLGGSLQELRIDHGPGYRVYFARIGKEVLLLLCAGDNRSQSRDIKAARAFLADYKRRTGASEDR
jgi:putative addiction module killer protein